MNTTTNSRIRRTLIAAGSVLVLFGSAASVRAQNGRGSFVTFEVPGSPNTFPVGINDFLSVAGSYQDANGARHGFIREPNGAITTFDVPGSPETEVVGISLTGAVAGTYGDPSGAEQVLGFVRSRRGTVDSFDPDPEGHRTQTRPSSINVAGGVTGSYRQSGGPDYGFVRSPQGRITTLDESTYPTSINVVGVVTGMYWDAFGGHGFVRTHQGTTTLFDGPSAGATYPRSINAVGTITGNAGIQGFVRSPRGTITTFDVPGADGTFPLSINSSGAIAGYYVDSTGQHGFIRHPGGAIATFDAPESTSTSPAGINDWGFVVGSYQNADGNSIGFVRVP